MLHICYFPNQPALPSFDVSLHVVLDCAVCEVGYSPSLAHTCTRCSNSRQNGLVAIAAVVAVVTVCAIAVFLAHLLSTEPEERGVGCLHRRVSRGLPLQAFKIVVVVWQIVTQASDSPSLAATVMTFVVVPKDFESNPVFERPSARHTAPFTSHLYIHVLEQLDVSGSLMLKPPAEYKEIISCTVLAKRRHRH